MRIAVVGAGVMGQFFGARLIASGHDVVLIDTSDETIDRIRSRGLRVVTDGVETHVEAHIARAAEVSADVELLVVFTKTMHTRAALESVRHLVSPTTLGLSVQNGLGNDGPLRDVVGAGRTLIGMTDYPADLRADGAIHVESSGRVVIGGVCKEATGPATVVARALDDAGLNASPHPDVLVPIWEKVAFNAALNTLSAAAGLTVGNIADDAEARQLVEETLAETFAIAAAERVAIDEQRVRDTIERAYRGHALHRSSMLVDIDSGRPTEVDAIGGAVCQRGISHGIDAPVLSTLCSTVRLRSRAGSAAQSTSAVRPSSVM